MKTIFIEARYDIKEKLSKDDIDALPNHIALCSSVQFLDNLKIIKKQLEDNGKKVILIKGMHAKYDGQLLGCDIYGIDTDADCYLYIGDGQFHPMALGFKSEKEVFIFNPLSKKIKTLDKNLIEKIKKRKKGALLKYYSAKNVGLLVTTKPGQNKLDKALEFKDKSGKNVFVFITDTLDLNELENFPFIESWVNTMCPRISEDYNLVNIEDIK